MSASGDSVTHKAWVDAIGVPAWVTSKERSILHLNNRAELLFNCPASACVGRRCYEILGGRTQFVPKSGAPQPFCQIRCPVQSALRQGRELPPKYVRVLGPGGGHWIRLLLVPFRNEDGTTLVVHCALPADKEHRLKSYVAQLAHRSSRPIPADLGGLSPREQDVLGLLTEDLTLREIAERLGVSYITVRNHVQHLLSKLQAHSTAEAVAVGLLGTPDGQKSTVKPRRCVSPNASGSNR